MVHFPYSRVICILLWIPTHLQWIQLFHLYLVEHVLRTNSCIDVLKQLLLCTIRDAHYTNYVMVCNNQ